ncbi:hypothetical protein PILCRDRAFT_98075 [Piloderma croceum F 1598]|uniref:Carboxylesterase type B domain-containing protein n=1 Tax=Piloderma croceum (strain F 1598) TaxID=765440 RepID=A0A0C3FID7_PILCF|nr:hypothetical protein PILCRDRAFT_98075 [Piloderma croceum F 1598]
MIALAIFICSLLLVSTSTLASPLVPVQPGQFFNPSGLLCNLPIVNKILCPRQDGTLGLSVKTPLGVARGVSDASGAMRFSVKYAAAQRWAASSMAKTWQLPNGASNPSALPLVCPQDNVKPSAMSEDCLSMILYVPKSVKVGSGAPVMVWVHGGSFIVGSATDAGLDGSKLASATGAIVAVIQYRLGALGFLGPDGSTNLGLADFMLALQFLQKVLLPRLL